MHRLGEEEAKLQAEKTAHEATRAKLQAAKTTTNTTTSNTSDNDSYNTSGNDCYSDYEESPQNDTLARAEDAFSKWKLDDGNGNESGNSPTRAG